MAINYLCVVGFFGLFIFTASADGVVRKNGYCVTYGTSNNTYTSYNGPAKYMSDEDFTLLKSICPYLAENGSNHTKTCCDAKQLNTLREYLTTTISTLLSHCPACYRNYRNVWCELTCSSNQSMFVDFKEWAYTYYITNQFAVEFYDSCRDVEMADGRKVMDLMCGTTEKLCNPEKFLKFIGRPENGAPLPTDFKIDQAARNISSNDLPMRRCNESFVEEGTGKISPACSCQNCRETFCPPTSSPPPEKPSNKYVITINATTDFPIDRYRVYQDVGPLRNFSGLIHKYILKEILYLHQNISEIEGELNNETVNLEDVCIKPAYPNNTNCKVESLLQYFQMSEANLNKCITNLGENCSDLDKFGFDAEDWHDQILGCTRVPTSVSNGIYLKLPCLSTYREPIHPNHVVADYENGGYISAKSLILTYFLNNDQNETQQLQKKAWGESLEKFLSKWQINHAPFLNLSLSFKHVAPNVTPTSPVSTTKNKSSSASNLHFRVSYGIFMFVSITYFVLHLYN